MEAVAFLSATAVGFMWGYVWADARRQIRENRMSEFKIGDRVRVKHFGDTGTDSAHAGQIGTVSSLPRPTWNYHRVALDNDPSDLKWYEDLPVREDEIEHIDG